MSRFDSIVSAEAWERLVRNYEELIERDATELELVDLLRDTIWEVEGIE